MGRRAQQTKSAATAPSDKTDKSSESATQLPTADLPREHNSPVTQDTKAVCEVGGNGTVSSKRLERPQASSWLMIILLLISVIWTLAAVTALELGWLRGADRASRIEFSHFVLKIFCVSLVLVLGLHGHDVWHRLVLLSAATTDVRNVALLRIALAGIAFLSVSCWTFGLTGYEDRELFDCGSEFCFPPEALRLPPTLAVIFSALRIPRYTMNTYKLVRGVVQCATVLMAVGFWARLAALLASLGLFYILGLRVSWTFGLPEMVGLSDNHIPWLLMFCATYPHLSEAWSLDAALRRSSNPHTPTGQVPACLHVSAFLLLGIIYLPSGVMKLWWQGLDWFLDESLLASHVSFNAVCGGLAEGPPQVKLHELPSAELLFRGLGFATVVLEVAFLPCLLLCGSGPKQRIMLCVSGFLFHKGIRLVAHIDFWSLTYTYLALVEWVDVTWVEHSGIVDDPKAGRCKGHRCGSTPFMIVSALVLMSFGYHGILQDSNQDFPVCGYPTFEQPRPMYSAVGQGAHCPDRDTLWNLRMTLNPPLAGYHELDLLTDLMAHHETFYMPYAVLIEQCLLHLEQEEVLKALRHLLEMVRVRLDPAWSGISVDIIAEARIFSRQSTSIADIGTISRLPVQRYFLQAEGGGGKPLFRKPGGRPRLAVGSDPGPSSTWELFVCGNRWDENQNIPVNWAPLPHAKGYDGRIVSSIGMYGMNCPEVMHQRYNSTALRQRRAAAARRARGSPHSH